MWKHGYILVLLFFLNTSSGQLNGNDLTRHILNSVNERLKGIENLGSEISANVNNALANNLQNLNNLGSQISKNVNDQINTMNKQLNKSLMSVYALNIKSKMENGIGGTTIINYRGLRPRSLIIKNGVRYICNGYIQESQCVGTLLPFSIESKEDYCFSKSHAIINDNVCLATSSISVQYYNNYFNCYTMDGSPVIILTQQEYRQLCENEEPREIIYQYYADPNDPAAVQIPNSNPHIKCLNNRPNFCEFKETEGFLFKNITFK